MAGGMDKGPNHNVAARVRAAHAREHALAATPERPRSGAAVRDVALSALAGADGTGPLARAGLARLAARHPRAGAALRDATLLALALRGRRHRHRRAG